MCLIGFSHSASSSVISPILSIFVRNATNATVEMVGLVAATYFITSSMARFSLAMLVSGKRTITFLLYAFIIFALCPVFYPLTDNIILLMMLRAVQGFAAAFIGTASLTLVGLTMPTFKRDKGFGTYSAWKSLGLLAGPAITSLSIPLFGVSNMFYIAGLVGIIGCFAAFFLNKQVISIEKNWQITEIRVTREAVKSKLLTIMRNKLFRMAFLGNFAFFFFFGVLVAYAPLYAKETLNFSNEFISLLFFVYYIATTSTRMFLGKIIRKTSKPPLIILSVILAALLSFSLAIVMDKFVFTTIFALVGMVQGVLFPVGSMLVASNVKPSRIMLANSLYVVGLDIGLAIAPLITVSVIHYGLEYSFALSGVVLATTTLLLIWLKTRA